VKTLEEEGVGMRSLVRSTLGVRGVWWSFKIGIRKNDERVNYSHGPTQTKQQVG